jgi:dinuclear metal center YbgI/SA1388 family protein
MPTVNTIARFLEDFAPTQLAESWDNVGLLVGDRGREVGRVMTCLTITGASAAEAIAEKVELIVTHHPLPFHPLKRLTTDSSEGRILWELIGAGISIYSPHTAFDSAREGINRRLAEGLGLVDIMPLIPAAADANAQGLGAGRFGRLPANTSLGELADRVKGFLKLNQLQIVGAPDRGVSKVAVACGSAGEFLPAAHAAGCDTFVTGETRFHTCLEAEALDVGLILGGHYATERFAVECLADVIAEQFTDLVVWASRREQDPVRWH